MTALLLALATLASPAETPAGGDPAPRTAAETAPAAEARTAEPTRPAPPAPAPEAIPATPEPAPLPSFVSALPAISALAALGAVGLLLSRRRGGSGRRLVQVVETAHLGPKRQLVVARMDGQILLLGSSESGITLLASRPAAPEVEAEAKAAEASPPAAADAPAGRFQAAVTRLFERRRDAPPPAEGSAFESMLEERSEDLELRRKLASGLAGRVA
ncbi:MAG TPA: flagellar biosynthetic protein FliO [Anaeromyxobacteraceae bacterium]|nr:flagellar biosynthetic protein FliO [Anaeromyxobacteraceae bacterium]